MLLHVIVIYLLSCDCYIVVTCNCIAHVHVSLHAFPEVMVYIIYVSYSQGATSHIGDFIYSDRI